MQKRLILKARGSTTDPWIKENNPNDLVVCLDPNPCKIGVPTTISIKRDSELIHTAFIGALNPLHHPLWFLESAISLLNKVSEDCVIQFPFWQNQYLYQQLLKSLLDVLQPTEIYIDQKITLPPNFAYLKVQQVSFEEGPTETFLKSKRRSYWTQFLEEATLISVPLDEVYLEGSRIGSEKRLNTVQFDKSILYTELLGTTLFMIVQRNLTPYQKKMALAEVGALKMIEVPCGNYSGLICNLQERSLLNVNLGVIQEIDFFHHTIHLFVSEPVPLNHIQLGLLRLNNIGKELEEQSSLAL